VIYLGVLISACGVVRRALHVPSWRQVALKTVSLFEREKRSQLVKELLALSTLHSPYIIDFLGAFYKEGITTIVLEYMNRNSLQEILRTYGPVTNEIFVAHIARQLFKGLEVFHTHKHVHRDIKPGNILINHWGDVKLADFGVLTALEGTADLATTYVGTTLFMSPERVVVSVEH
jgi:serine/threonine protein kinase